MIEQEMIFALGFLSALLVSLLCLPAVWRRALRLSERRLRQLVPLSMDEIIADRDHLRAGFAVEQRRIEQRAERAEAAHAEGLAEQARLSARLEALEGERGALEARCASLTADRDAALRERAEQDGEIGALRVALESATDLADRRRWQLLDAEGRLRAQVLVHDEARVTIAALETRMAAHEARADDLDQELKRVKAERDSARAERDSARAERDSAHAERDSARAERDSARAERDSARAEAPERSAVAAEAQAFGPTAEDIALVRAALIKFGGDILALKQPEPA